MRRLARGLVVLASLGLPACSTLLGLERLEEGDASGDAGGRSDGVAPDGTQDRDRASSDGGDTTRDGAVEDDASSTDADAGCSTTLGAVDRIVFVTQATFDGNLGGAAGADAKCQSAATAAANAGIGALSGKSFRAWISDAAEEARCRVDRTSGFYKTVDGTVIATGWQSGAFPFASGTHQAVIATTEMNSAVSGVADVWTGTDAYGTLSYATCSGWTDASGGGLGVAGSTNYKNVQWSNNAQLSCATSAHLYCVEHVP